LSMLALQCKQFLWW